MKKTPARRSDGKQSLTLEYKDGAADVELLEGKTPLIRMKRQPFKNVNEVLEMLNKKL